ncbi:MAG: glycosyltransferase family A protein [Parcubacteria group bacterium]|jgi:glycosyltransferase involved in cell wall biosynthesis
MPQISVVIPCYNHGKYLEEAVISVKKQTFSDYEIIVVNDGSTDEETIMALDQLKEKYTDVLFIDQENGHLANARNTGIRVSQGEFFLPLDADDKIDSQMLERCLREIQKDNRLGFVYTYTQFFGDFTAILPRPQYDFYELLRKNYIVASALIRKSAWREIGGYDENMKSGYEDWEFYIRLAKNGWYGKLIRKPLFYYRKHGKSMISDATIKNDMNAEYIRTKHADIYAPEKLHAIKIEWKKKNRDRYWHASFYTESFLMTIFIFKRYGFDGLMSRIKKYLTF